METDRNLLFGVLALAEVAAQDGRLQARNYDNLGNVWRQTGRLEQAENAYRAALSYRKRPVAHFPAVAGDRWALAWSYNNLGLLLKEKGRPDDVETVVRMAVDLLKQLAPDFPNNPEYQNYLAGTIVNLAQICRDSNEYSQARELLKNAVPHHEAALKGDPSSLKYQGCFEYNRIVLATVLAGLGDHVGAIQTAEQLAALGWNPASDAYNAARALAQCMPVIEKDWSLPESKRQERIRLHVDKAMAILRQAVAKGYNDAAQMKKDSDLDPLRSRPDYQRLLSELETRP